jgi:hypothetical protein
LTWTTTSLLPRRELNTTGVSDTVRTALQQVAAKSARARQIEWLQSGDLESMADADKRGKCGADRLRKCSGT